MQKISDTQCSGRQPAAANSLEQNPGNSSVPRPASNSVSFHVWTVPGVCPATRRQWADFLAALTVLPHRQYKTARTETRWHLLLKTRQMPIQTSASRGYVLFISGNKRHTKVLKLSAGLRTHPAECSKLGKTQIVKDAGRGMVRNTGFCDQNTSCSCIRNLSRSFVLHTTVRDDVSPTTAVRRLPLLRAADTAAALPLLLRAP